MGIAAFDRPYAAAVSDKGRSAIRRAADHDLCFWGGVWGAVFGLILPRLPASYPMWVRGLGLGIAAALVGLLVVPLLKGLPEAGGWAAMSFVLSFLINGFWGIGVGVFFPLLARSALSKPA